MKDYKLIWSEEFDYNGKPDSNKWSYNTGGHGWGNGESQYYTEELKNSYVDNGTLKIVAIKEKTFDNDYSSARIVTKEKFDFLHGRVDVSAKIPGKFGTWPAIWMLPTNWNRNWPDVGEIDIMEHFSNDDLRNYIHHSIHTNNFNHRIGIQKTYKEKYDESLYTKFNKYSVVWEEDYLEFLVNDETKYKVTRQEMIENVEKGEEWRGWPFTDKFHIILNVAIGGWIGDPKPDFESDCMEVEYIRVYQK